MKKSFLFSLFSVLFFSLGFLTHALFFPEFLANGVIFPQNLKLSQTTPQQEETNAKPLITEIKYDGKKFGKHNVTVEVTRYIAITNTSKDTLMWLVSDNPLLTTPRGYGESEQVKAQMNKKGQFIIADKNNPEEKLIITVK